MSKEVVYIDVNDDITSVIEKIKQSREKIVALVPPKQASLLQSAVNLQLLAKSAKDSRKHIVIITAKDSLVKLAATARIPVAKTLQSKPVLAPVPTFAAEDDLIDGENLPVGELAAMGSSTKNGRVKTDEVIVDPTNPTTEPPKPVKKAKSTSFWADRKKVVLVAGGAVLLIGFLVWAIVFAPKATITLKTLTKAVNINQVVTLAEDSSKTNNEQNIIHAQTQILDKNRTIEFAATGEKDVGAAATGEITLTNTSNLPINVPADTGFTSGNCTFVTTEARRVPGPTVISVIPPEVAPGTAKVTVRANRPGSECNLGARNYTSPIKNLTASGGDMSGGSSKVVKTVTQADFDGAKQKLMEIGNKEAVNELKNKFDASAIVIEESLRIKEGEIKSSVGIDQEAPEGKAVLEQPVNYNMTAVVRTRLVEYLNYLALSQEKDAKMKQKVYESGDDQVQFSDFISGETGAMVKVSTQMKIGPDINVEEIKEFAKGKGFGEIQNKYEAIGGVKNVDVDFRPMWVRRVPKNTKRITVKIEQE